MVIDDLRSKLVEFSKAGDALRLGVLRYFLSQVKNKEIELRPSKEVLTDEIVFKVLRKQIKQTREAIEMAQTGKRQDLVEKNEKELEVLKEFAKMFPYELDI